MYHVPLAVQCIYGCGDEEGVDEDGKKGVKFLENGSEWRLPSLLYADDLVVYGESKEDLRGMAG